MSGYIGTQPVPQATQTRDSFTATSGQTSFATGGYTPNFLDIFLNGVKLSAADYTASNGSDVVLASGAATGDILEVVAYTTFTVGSSFTPSIDDNGNATAITIDSNEGVNIGKTSAALGTVGLQLSSTGHSAITTNHNTDTEAPLRLNKLNGDGSLLRLYKDSSEVGSIGVNSGDQVYFAASDGMGIKVDTDNTSVEASNASGADNDNAVNLGSSGTRWKDAYLSGGVYLGGTGSANKLDDYETGTWTPAQGTFGTWNSPVFVATYTKIGRQVTVLLRQDSGTVGWSSNNAIAGLPFTVSYQSIGYASDSGPSSDNGPILIWPSNLIYFKQANSSENALVLTATYFTND